MSITGTNGHKLRLSPETRSRLEQDVEQMRKTLQDLDGRLSADIGRVESKVNKILQVLTSWTRRRSPAA